MNTFSTQPKNFTGFHALYRTACLVLICLSANSMIHAQVKADKRLVLADKYFAEGNYFTAAGLYGQFLDPVVKTKSPSDFPLNANRNAEGRTGNYATRTDILFKQAESYRLANYWQQAVELYRQCFEKDPSRFSSALYWQAVGERSLGHYTQALETINSFINEHAKDNELRQAAEKERLTLQFINSQVKRPDTVMYKIQKIHSSFGKEKGVFAPVALQHRFMVTSTQSDSAATGQDPYRNRLFNTRYSNGSFSELEPVFIEGLDASMNQGTASMSSNGDFLYFTQWKTENGELRSSIYFSSKNITGWSKPVLMLNVNHQGSNSRQPFVSADGKYLFFASDMKGGAGGYDIWYAPLYDNGTTGEPVNLGHQVNSANNEQSPYFHAGSSTLVFASDRNPGMGGYDLYMSKMMESAWQTPENMGYPVNSSRDDLYFYSTGTNLLDNAYFSSDRGSECCLATYHVSKKPKNTMLKGIAYDCRFGEPLAGAEIVLSDNQGTNISAFTGEDGSYQFDIRSDRKYTVSLKKEGFLDTTAHVIFERINTSAWQTDTIHNSSICLEKKLVIKVENVVTVYFDFDRFDLKERGIAQMDSIYNIMLEDSTTTLQISGYTDGLGSVEYNAKLSDKRARSCADYLIQKGIEPARITFESFGACCPVEMELINGRDNPDGRSMNRRALINVSRRSE